MVTVTGNRKDEEGKFMTEELELWLRDPVDCVKELIGNPSFRESMAYAPEKAFATDDPEGDRIYDEGWTGDWWWQTQVI